ncbi:MAG: glycosyltransferase [Candidatus Gastranaerophilales bacterium]|nr:glycosyltransferase [Candidatus Gastranaerophilales bacterium]
MPKISIIVPVYNAEKYLEKCLNSLTGQTYNDIEIILANDGSTDSSLEICNRFAERDNRIVVFTQENAGPSVARNNALKLAKGEFIGFVDSDDFIEPDTYEKAIKHMTDDVNLVIWGVKVVSDDKLSYINWFQDYFNAEYKELQDLTLDKKFRISVVPWNKLYRKSIIEEKQIDFPAGRLYEDNAFWWKYTMWCGKAYFIPEMLHYYNMRLSSLRGEVINTKKDKEADRVYMIENVYDYCKNHNILSENKTLTERLFVNAFTDAFQETEQKEKLVGQAAALADKMKLQNSADPDIKNYVKELIKINKHYEKIKNLQKTPEFHGVNQAIKEIKKRVKEAKEDYREICDVRLAASNIKAASKLTQDLIDDFLDKKGLKEEINFLNDYYKYFEPAEDLPYTQKMLDSMLDFVNSMYSKGLADEVLKFCTILYALYPQCFEFDRIKGDTYYFLKKEPLKAFYYYRQYTMNIKNNASVFNVMAEICEQRGDIFHQLVYKQTALNAEFH